MISQTNDIREYSLNDGFILTISSFIVEIVEPNRKFNYVKDDIEISIRSIFKWKKYENTSIRNELLNTLTDDVSFTSANITTKMKTIHQRCEKNIAFFNDKDNSLSIGNFMIKFNKMECSKISIIDKLLLCDDLKSSYSMTLYGYSEKIQILNKIHNIVMYEMTPTTSIN